MANRLMNLCTPTREMQVREPELVFSGWFYVTNDQRHGPVGSDEISRFVTSGQLEPDAVVWKGWIEGERTRFVKCEARSALRLWRGVQRDRKAISAPSK